MAVGAGAGAGVVEEEEEVVVVVLLLAVVVAGGGGVGSEGFVAGTDVGGSVAGTAVGVGPVGALAVGRVVVGSGDGSGVGSSVGSGVGSGVGSAVFSWVVVPAFNAAARVASCSFKRATNIAFLPSRGRPRFFNCAFNLTTVNFA